MIKFFERARERRALEQEKSQRIAELTLRVRALEAENSRLRRKARGLPTTGEIPQMPDKAQRRDASAEAAAQWLPANGVTQAAYLGAGLFSALSPR